MDSEMAASQSVASSTFLISGPVISLTVVLNAASRPMLKVTAAPNTTITPAKASTRRVPTDFPKFMTNSHSPFYPPAAARCAARGEPGLAPSLEVFPRLGSGGTVGAAGGGGRDGHGALLARHRAGRRTALHSRGRTCRGGRLICRTLSDPVAGNQLRQARGLLGQRLRRRGSLFHQRRVLLRHIVHHRDRLV